MKKGILLISNVILITGTNFLFSQVIKEVKIGTQVWMQHNLDVDTFRNGDPIPEAKTREEWQRANQLERPAWCYYENKKSNGKKFGKLYNGFALIDSRGLAPEGFHIATDLEWTQLIQSTGDTTNAKTILNNLNFNLGTGGYRYDGGSFNDMDKSCFWWSNTEYFQSQNAFLRQIDLESQSVRRDLHGYDWGFYVRCVKDSAKSTLPKNSAKTQMIKIGNQVWMQKNLNVGKFRNGDPIPEAQTEEEWMQAALNNQPAWCYYKKDPKYGETYGKLYNWYAVHDRRGIAPKGWHVPSDEEWTVLMECFREDSVAGRSLKSASGWNEYQPVDSLGEPLPTTISGNGSNKSGFSGLPGGCRFIRDIFSPAGNNGYWWSSTKAFADDAWIRNLGNDFSEVKRENFSKAYGLSVRCIKD